MQICWLLACACDIAWVVVWTREELFVGFILMLLCTISGIGCISFLVFTTEEIQRSVRKEAEVDIALIYIFIHNGIDAFFTWTTVSTMVNLSVFLTHDPVMNPNMPNTSASTIALSVLLGLVVIRAVLENTAFYKHIRHMYAWYGVVIWFCVDVLQEKNDPTDVNAIFTIALISTTFFCLAAKLFVSLCRKRVRPAYEVNIPLR